MFDVDAFVVPGHERVIEHYHSAEPERATRSGISKDGGSSGASWFETARSLSSGRAARGPDGASSP